MRALLFLLLCLIGPTAASDMPNILFVLSDDHSYPFLGCYGRPEMKTPHLDRMAAEGVMFRRMFTGAPQCVPSRATIMMRNVEITQDVYDLIIFMTNSFIRPTDIKVLQHKHVAVVRGKDTYLRLTHPPTKGHGGPVVTMERAVVVYDSLLARQREAGFGKPDDYLFCPHQLNRDYALRDIARQFDQVLKVIGLKETPNGEARTLYSLRHTCIMFRLINGDGIDPFKLARNARTSHEMIDRFYAKHLTAEMNIAQLQSGAHDD